MANSKLTGCAGEHYVAYALSTFDYICALVREGSPTIDLLASNVDGSKTVSVQVKTSRLAKRKRGRGNKRDWHHLEFTLGKRAIQHAAENFFFCFVDFRGVKLSEAPDVYIIPSEVIKRHYEKKDISKIKWLRLHWSMEEMKPYKNNWEPFHNLLKPVTIGT